VNSCCRHTDILVSLLAWSDWQQCRYLSLQKTISWRGQRQRRRTHG